MSEQVERVDWETFLRDRFRWEQGQHVGLIGPTGSGKTTLALALLPLRDYVIAFGTKPKDRTLESLLKDRRSGWKRVERWDRMPNTFPRDMARIVFWPKYAHPSDRANQRFQIQEAMGNAFTDGGWCGFVDELWYFDNKLGLKNDVEEWWTQGRSIGLSLVAGTQRPAHVSLLLYDQSTHVFFWRDNDERNLKRISGMNGLNSRTIRETVATLDPHEVLYVNTRTGEMVRTTAPQR